MVRYFSFALKYNKWTCFLKKQGAAFKKVENSTLSFQLVLNIAA